MRRLDATRFFVEGADVLTIECCRRGQPAQRADNAFELAIESGGVHACGLEQAPFERLAVAREDAPDQDAGQKRAREHGSEHEHEEVDLQRAHGR